MVSSTYPNVPYPILHHHLLPVDKETDVFVFFFYRQLVLYPQGEGAGDNESISLRLAMVERDDMPLGCDVNVKASFFLYDQIRDRYLVIEGTLKSFSHVSPFSKHVFFFLLLY
jgi:hypothetical protein